MVKVAIFMLLATACVHSRSYGTARSGEPLQYDWSAFRQGTIAIDEHDFYRIAGEREAADAIERERATGERYNVVGWVIAAAGAAGLVYGAVARDRRGYGVALALPIGGTMAFYGRARANKTPQLSRERARQAAARYNATLGLRSEP